VAAHHHHHPAVAAAVTAGSPAQARFCQRYQPAAPLCHALDKHMRCTALCPCSLRITSQCPCFGAFRWCLCMPPPESCRPSLDARGCMLLHRCCLQVPVVPGESVPDGVARIEAVTSAGIADTTAGVDLAVGIMDSGIVSGNAMQHTCMEQPALPPCMSCSCACFCGRRRGHMCAASAWSNQQCLCVCRTARTQI
jgi:hypothetical protein